MLSQYLAKTLPGEQRFRWRGGDVSRLEGIVDAAFAFALTLLLVSTEMPSNLQELVEFFVQLPVLLVTFALLILVWHEHFIYHRRYGLEDPLTRLLNFAALFLVLVYVYPLKFLFHLLYNHLVLGRPWDYADPGGTQIIQSYADMQLLMILYSAGGVAVFGLFALMFWRAWRLRAELGLDPVEQEITRGSMRTQLISVGIAGLSVAIAAANERWGMWAGMAYFLMWPTQWWHGVRTGRAVERLEEQAATAAAADSA